MCVCVCVSHSVMSDSLQPHGVLQVPLSMEFSRQECWSGLLFPSPEDVPDPGIQPKSPALQADSLPSEPPTSPEVQWLRNLIPMQRTWVQSCSGKIPHALGKQSVSCNY